MRRVGFVGTENSHTDHFLRFLNLECRHPGYRATALAGGRNERNLGLAETAGIDTIVDDPAELVGRVDAVVISTRDGARHREQAEPLLTAGIPVLVDKPFATTVADADAILTAARAGSALVHSASALRFAPVLAEVAGTGAQLRHLRMSGPADPDSPYSGLAFYGIHQIETVLEILDNPVLAPEDLEVSIERDQGQDGILARFGIGGVRVTLTFVGPGAQSPPFHVAVESADGAREATIVLGPDYNAPVLAAFIGAIESGSAPLTPAQLRSPVVVLAAITDALAA